MLPNNFVDNTIDFGFTVLQSCVAGTVTLTGSDPTSGPTGNIKIYGIAGGANVNVSAFSQNKAP